MSSTKQDWTPEPWQTGREDGQSYHGHSGEPFSSIYRQDDDERMPLTTDGFGGLTRVPLRIAYIEGKDVPREEEKANARRIVACVNALANIPDPAAYMKERADYIERLEAVVKAADEVAKRARDTARLARVLVGSSLAELHPNDFATRHLEVVTDSYNAARARVNLPAPPDSSVNPATLTSQSQAGEVDGKEASNGKEA